MVVWMPLLAGCSMAGAWRTTEITPKGAPFPIQELSIDAKGQYTSSGMFDGSGNFDGEAHTATGTYSQGLGTLTLKPTEGTELVYRVRRRLDGKLVLTFRPPGAERSVTALMTAAKP